METINEIRFDLKCTVFILLTSFFFCCHAMIEDESHFPIEIDYDSHVHIMSPDLISYWKDLGIPFTKSESRYSNVDSILYYNKAKHINLIGMGYVYGNPEYYEGDDSYLKLKSENNYLLKCAKVYPDRITPFFTIDPLENNAIEELERCHEINSEAGLKLHFNASQVYLTEPTHLEKIKLIFEKSAEYKLPILLHFDNWHPKFGVPDINILVDSILTDIDQVQLQIAHFGTSGGFNDKTMRFLDEYLLLKNQNKIPIRHSILFDISAVALNKNNEGISKLSKIEFLKLKEYVEKIGIENIVFGTDYPLYNSAEYIKILKEKLDFSNEDLLEISKSKNIHDEKRKTINPSNKK